MKDKTEIVLRGVGMRFGAAEVLKDINLDLEQGRIYGLVGRNGSGKTVLLKIICGLLEATSGTVAFRGIPKETEKFPADNCGVLIENPGFLPDYDAYRNLKFLADIRHKIGKKEIREAIRTVGLDPDSRKHVGKYSLGMRERLGIAQAIMENPSILLLDEPTNGLDNEGVEEMRAVYQELRAEGKLVVLGSHSTEDIALLCDEVYYMDHGRIIDRQVQETEQEKMTMEKSRNGKAGG